MKFIPYWENKAITSRQKDVVIGYYQKKDSYLVLISNLNRKPKQVNIKFNSVKVNSAINAETGSAVKIKDGQITLYIPRNDYIALQLN